MNGRVLPKDIQSRHADEVSSKGSPTSLNPLPITIQSQNLRMDLIHSGKVFAGLQGVTDAVDSRLSSEASWTWAAFTRHGNPLGFVSLEAIPVSIAYDGDAWSHLNLACRRDKVHAPYILESIIALLDWLCAHQICAGIYADHAQSDLQLAGWLLEAGFVYNGRRGEHGRRQMICLL
jgi:hypothetical protein